MNLQTIHRRLDLFPQYLGYRAENWRLTAWGRLKTFEETGIFWIGGMLSFDQWLCMNGYFDLAETIAEYYDVSE